MRENLAENHDTDRAVVVRAQAGDRQALRLLFDANQRRVMAFCLAWTGRDREMARDLAQEVFVRVFRRIGQLDDPDRFVGWLYAVMRSVCLSRADKNSRHQRTLEAFAIEQGALAHGVDDHADRELRIEIVRAVIGDIANERTQRIVAMKYLEPEHTTREIAETLAIPHGTVTVTLMRFRAGIRDKLVAALTEGGVAP